MDGRDEPLKTPRRLWVVGLTLALLLGSAVFAVEGSGGGPEVLSQNVRVRFAEGVTFNVEVEAETPVVEVKLNFRNANDGPWNYVYLDVEPDTRIQATHLLDTDGPIYIPPQGALEYFYTVRDAAGNVSKTPLQSLLYTDTRFRWESVTAGPLTLLYHDLPASRVENLKGSLEESLVWLEDVLGGRPEKQMLGVIYNDDGEVRDAFPRLSRTIDTGQIFHGFAFADWNLFTGIGLRESLIVHESAHLMLHAVVHDPAPPIPAWLNEGFASYAEPRSNPQTAADLENRSEGPISLRGMHAVPGRVSDIRYFYRKSESVVTHMLERYGAEKFRDLLYRFGHGSSIDDALMETYGFDQNGLEQEWRFSSDYVAEGGSSTGRNAGVDGGTGDATAGESRPRGNSQESGGDLLFLQMESVLIASVALLAAAVLGARFLYRRLSSRRSGRGDENEWRDGGPWEG